MGRPRWRHSAFVEYCPLGGILPRIVVAQARIARTLSSRIVHQCGPRSVDTVS